MGTERPRIQAYVEPKLYQAFIEWKTERGIDKDSAALNELLKRYLGKLEKDFNSGGLSDERLRMLIQEELQDSGRRDFNWQALEQKDEIKELRAKINELEARLALLEANKLPGELSSELSSELPSESLTLSCSQLARRLGVNHGTISKKSKKADFGEWTKARDPDAIAWSYDASRQRYIGSA
ncbi:MAG TPA: hypothetical protein V6D11_12430 [Waterburya sp.]|jgi:hypothetical protein